MFRKFNAKSRELIFNLKERTCFVETGDQSSLTTRPIRYASNVHLAEHSTENNITFPEVTNFDWNQNENRKGDISPLSRYLRGAHVLLGKDWFSLLFYGIARRYTNPEVDFKHPFILSVTFVTVHGVRHSKNNPRSSHKNRLGECVSSDEGKGGWKRRAVSSKVEDYQRRRSRSVASMIGEEGGGARAR